jgi:FkbM family methyltransferase
MNAYCAAFAGDPRVLKWNAKDLESLKAIVREYCSEHRSAVQAGGCLGVFASWLSFHFAKVYTFEPDPRMFSTLVSNVPAANVVKLQAALGCERGRLVETVCSLRGNEQTLHQGMTRTESGGHVPTLRLDDLAIADCDLLYLDIEGDELPALMGAIATIKRSKPIVVCEINSASDHRAIPRSAVPDLLRSVGYDLTTKYRSDHVFTPTRPK